MMICVFFQVKPFIVQAFAAMGGGSDGKGSISTEKLKSVIKDEFQMTVDIEVRIFILKSNRN